MADNGVETKGKMEEASSYGGGNGAGAETGWWFKPKGGRLNPHKKKLVKTMMMEKLFSTFRYLVSTLRNNKAKRKISPHDSGYA
ncbi:hypothetical protein U1Q18_037222 [Sarracenia purpurea var. burkii]